MIAFINTPCLKLSHMVTQHSPGQNFDVEHVGLDDVDNVDDNDDNVDNVDNVDDDDNVDNHSHKYILK